MTITRRASKRDHGPTKVTLDRPEITWEGDCLVVRQSRVKDGTLSPTRHNYEISITLDEFRRMVGSFVNPRQ